MINPVVHGDGVGYYAYARAPLIQHSLHFEEDWRHANLNFSQSRTGPDGQLLPEQYTETGYVSNLFTIGPALLWFPFLLLAHLLVLLLNFLGMPIAANGFSFPYLVAMALGTAIYGFLGLLLLVFTCPKICWGAVGISRDAGHLVGEFSPRLHVLQSRLVARALGLRRRALPLVLGPHTSRPHDLAMADSGAHLRLDGRHLLSQWCFPSSATD